MTQEAVVLVLEAEGEIDDGLRTQVESATGSEVRTVSKHGLAGDVSSWLLIGNFVVASLATLAPILSAFIKDRRVKSVKLGELVIENPTAEQVESVLRTMAGRQDGPA